MNKRLSGILKIRLVASVFNRLSTDSLIIYATIFMVEKMGSELAGATTIGILLVGFITNLYGGTYSDAKPNRWILPLGWGGHTFVMFLMFVSVNYSIYLFVIFYLAKNIVFSFVLPSAEKIIFSNTNEGNRRYFFQINSWLSGVSSSIGILVGGYLYIKGIGYVILFSMLMSLVVSICYSYIQQCWSNFEYIENSNVKGKVSVADYKYVFKNKNAILIVFSAIMLSGIEFSFGQYIPVYISHLSFESIFNDELISGVEYFSWVKTISVICGMVFSLYFILLIGKLDEKTSKRMLIISMSVFVLSYIVMLVYMENALFFAFFAILSALMGVVYHPIRYSEYMNHIEKNRSGIYLSVYSLNSRIGNVLAGVILMISNVIGHGGVVLIVSLMGVVSVFIMMPAIRREFNTKGVESVK
ncbi:MFS transporter [Serratia plymuthica]|uniref:MFS transporter n=1 Tax=Serratia plymuthica TaxID=82996 RepID=UPI003DA4DB92